MPLGNVLTHYTGSWHAVYAVGTGMNLVAALLGFFVLRPIINVRLAPGAGAARVQAPPEPRIRQVA